MKPFKSFLAEDCRPEAHVEKCIIDITDPTVRSVINARLDNVTARGFITPYAAFEAVYAALSAYHIFLPKTILEGDHGVETWPVRQFGQIAGMNDKGEVVTKPESEYNVYFEYQTNDTGWFKVFCEIVTVDELEDLLDDVEDQINEEMLSEAKMTPQDKRVMINTIRQAMRFGKNLKPEKTKQLTAKQKETALDRQETAASHAYHQMAVQMPKVEKPKESSYEHLWKKSMESPRTHYEIQNLNRFLQIAKAELKSGSMNPDTAHAAFKDYVRRQRALTDSFTTWADMADHNTLLDHIKAGHVPVTSTILQIAAERAKKADSLEGTTSHLKRINDLSAKTFGTVTNKKLFGLVKTTKPKIHFT